MKLEITRSKWNVELSLRRSTDGSGIILDGAGSDGVVYALLRIKNDGTLKPIGCVPPSMGFELDSKGRIVVVKD